MKSFIQYLTEEGEPWALPDYPEQVMAKDDVKGNWITGDSPKPIEFSHSMDGDDGSVKDTERVLDRASEIIRREREAQKPK